jgi:hypothetical protein
MWQKKRKLDEEKSKHASLAHNSDIGPNWKNDEDGKRHSRA